jgi:hypothetical protein
MWALIADVDLESEKIRWAGPLRFILMAIIRVIHLRRYRGTLQLWKDSKSTDTPEASAASHTSTRPLLPCMTRVGEAGSDGGQWRTVDDQTFCYFMAMNAPWCASDVLPAPRARLCDGLLDVVWIARGTRMQVLRFLLDTESGQYIHEPYVHCEKTRAFILRVDPVSASVGHLDVDGELFEYEDVVVECLPSLARLIVPRHHDESTWMTSAGLT